jgi:putative membrane protein
MVKFFIKLLLYAVAIMITSYLLPGVDVDSYGTAFILAALLALLNITLKPLLIILTIPFTIFTLGLFLLVINAAIILIADSIIPGANVDGFWWALLFSIIVSILNGLFSGLSKDEQRDR